MRLGTMGVVKPGPVTGCWLLPKFLAASARDICSAEMGSCVPGASSVDVGVAKNSDSIVGPAVCWNMPALRAYGAQGPFGLGGAIGEGNLFSGGALRGRDRLGP